MKAIITEYRGPTDAHPSARFRVTSEDCKPRHYSKGSLEQELDGADDMSANGCHRLAAKRFAEQEQHQWYGTWVSGSTLRGRVFVMVERSDWGFTVEEAS